MRKTKKLSALIIAACMSVGLAVPLNVVGVTALQKQRVYRMG